MDKELGALRKARWDKAFRQDTSSSKSASSSGSSGVQDAVVDVNRKATIVLEHLIQVGLRE